MTCATDLTAQRNADFSSTITFPEDYSFTGATFRMQVRTAEGAANPALIDVSTTVNVAGSKFTVVGHQLELIIKQSELQALPQMPVVADPWVGFYDIVMTRSGVVNYLFGGNFTVNQGVTR